MRLVALVCCALAVDAFAARARTVAVLYFDNNTGSAEYDVLQKGLADMLVTDLSTVSSLQVVEREKLEALLGELKLQRSGFFDPRTAQRLGKGIGAQYAVAGALAKVDPVLRIDVRLIEVATGKVVMADSVTGSKDRFFELEEALVRKFVAGLDLKMGQSAGGNVTDVATLLEYSRGVDSADRGDFQAASAQLAAVVRAAPNFKLAKDRYTEVLRKLREAGKRREGLMATAEAELTANIEKALVNPPSPATSHTEANRYFGYRVLRGTLPLLKAKEALGAHELPGMRGFIRPAARKEVGELLRAHFENALTYLAELERFSHGRDPRWGSLSPRVDPEDEKRAADVGLGRGAEGSLGSNPFERLYEFAAHGKTTHYELLFHVRPALVELHPEVALRLLPFLEKHVEQLAAGQDWERERAAQAVGWQADLLLLAGRREEALARWQVVLDRFPTSKEFPLAEQRIEEVLGMSKAWAELDQAIARCAPDLHVKLAMHAERIHLVEGGDKFLTRLRPIEKGCRGTDFALWMPAAVYASGCQTALAAGDCETFKKAFALLEKTKNANGVEFQRKQGEGCRR